jgi:hypothetical protein
MAEKTGGQGKAANSKTKLNPNIRIIAVSALIIVAAGSALLYFFVFSPKARVKHAFYSGVAAMKNEDITALAELVSDNYSDSEGNTKNTIIQAAAFLFMRFDDIKVSFKEIDFRVTGPESAIVTFGGRLLFKQDKEQYMMPIESRTMIYLTREQGVWRVTSTVGVDTSLQNIQKELM